MDAPERKYEKPAVIHREKIEVLAAVCDYNWTPNHTCRLIGEPACIRIRV